MIGGMLGLVISTLAFAIADTYPLLVLARVAQGVAGGASWYEEKKNQKKKFSTWHRKKKLFFNFIFFRTIGLGLLADVFPTKSLGVVMGTVLTAHTVGFAIGPAIGGFLYEFGGFAAPFLFCAGFAVINFLAIVWLAEPEHDHIKETSDHVSRAQENIEENDETTPLVKKNGNKKKAPLTMIDLLKNWRILSCVLCVMVSASVFAGIEPALPIHLQDTFNASASTVGCKYINSLFSYTQANIYISIYSGLCSHGSSCFPCTRYWSYF